MAMSDRMLPRAIPPARVAGESTVVQATLVGIAALFLLAVLFLPLAVVFFEGLRKGWSTFIESFADPDTLAAVRLTLLVAAIAVRSMPSSASRRPGPSPSSTSPARASC